MKFEWTLAYTLWFYGIYLQSMICEMRLFYLISNINNFLYLTVRKALSLTSLKFKINAGYCMRGSGH
jgi:hypothetical protein